MSDWQINSALLALHNIAKALGALAMMTGVFVVIGPVFWDFYSNKK